MDHFGLYPALLSLKDVERDVRFLADPGQTVVMPLLTNPAIRRGSIARTDQPSFNAGDGLQLRPWRQEDATAVAEVYQDLQIRRWRCRTIDDLAEAKSLIESWRRGWHDETGAAWA
ncbi:MAG: acetyltransferase, partial [Propionibacteriaceae bacterium]|nr:acetyltransferase [Propionibacteriaceae bacterium]